MTAHVLVSGTLFREPEQRISKAGKPFVTATIRAIEHASAQTKLGEAVREAQPALEHFRAAAALRSPHQGEMNDRQTLSVVRGFGAWIGLKAYSPTGQSPGASLYERVRGNARGDNACAP